MRVTIFISPLKRNITSQCVSLMGLISATRRYSLPRYSVTQTSTSGIYHIIWEDAEGCSDSSSIEIVEITPIQLQLEFFIEDEFLIANTNVSGGLPPYSYLWNDLEGNNYHIINNEQEIEVTATDLVGCFMVLDTSLIISEITRSEEITTESCTTSVFDTFGRLFRTLDSTYNLSHLKAILPSGLWLCRKCGMSSIIFIEWRLTITSYNRRVQWLLIKIDIQPRIDFLLVDLPRL